MDLIGIYMAGTVEKGETPVEGLIRELQEEIGMTITSLPYEQV